MNRIVRMLALAALVATLCPGCAGGLAQGIVAARNHQGDVAYDNGNFSDAAIAYKLALQLAPKDEHARAGLAAVQLRIAEQLYRNSKFDEALAALDVAARYDPQSVRLDGLRSEIEGARIKREIVVSNYPTYRETIVALRRAYVQLKTQSAAISSSLQRFDYTYDSAELTKAIRQSYELNAEVARLTNRLLTYRDAVESGSAPAAPESNAAGGSLLPLP